MDLYETNTHPFIIKVWLEVSAEAADPVIWRGHITHVPSGTRRYVQDMDEITAFIATYLQDMGVEFGPGWRVTFEDPDTGKR